MGFASPIWLFGLLPWGVVLICLLPGRGRAAVVPFLGLWRGSSLAAAPARRRWPRTAILSAIIGLLLAILAAGRPVGWTIGDSLGEVTIVLDRGATMSLPGASGRPFRNVLGTCGSVLGTLSDQSRVMLVPVPGQAVESRGNTWRAAAEALSPTAISVGLDQIVADQLRRTRGPVVVLSDQRLDVSDRRIVQIFPEPVAPSVAITAIGARLLPHPQVMVRLENHLENHSQLLSGEMSVEIHVESDGQAVGQKVTLPSAGRSVDRFVDLPRLGQQVRAWIDGNAPPSNRPENGDVASLSVNNAGPANGDIAGLSADNASSQFKKILATSPFSQTAPGGDAWSSAFLVRQSNGIHLDLGPWLDDSVRRMAEIYAKDRPATVDASEVLISSRPLPKDQSGIWIAAAANAVASTGKVVVLPHAVTRQVLHWNGGEAVKVPAGFSPLVWVGSVAVVAVRDDSARQVWLNADLRDWEKTADFVVFFANALDWIAGSDQSYQSVSPAFLGDDWHGVGSSKFPAGDEAGEWPGIYESASGRVVAVNAGTFPHLAGMENRRTAIGNFVRLPGRLSLSGGLVFAALGLLLLAALIW